jgi:hypothetical protein
VSFLYPLFLAGLVAVAVPILLHLFRRRTEMVVDFPAVRLLEKSPVEQQHRRRLRELILLALRVTALALLAFAFARPYLRSSDAAAPVSVTVVAVDVSLSMSAPEQWRRAQQSARDAVDQAPSTHSVALVAFADSATLVVPPTTDRGGVRAAIEQLQATTGGTRYRTALARASEAIASGDGRIVVVTDLQQAGWEANDEGAVPDGIELEVIEIAAPAGNLAVTTLRRDGDALIAGVHNFGVRAARIPVRLQVGDRVIATESIDIGAQAAAEARFTAPLPPRGSAVVRIEDEQGYAGDNLRYAILDPVSRLPVLIVTAMPPESSNAGLYVERALQVADDGRAFEPRVVDGRSIAQLPADRFAETAAVILLGTSTLDRAGRERIATYLKAGGRVLLTLGPDVDLVALPEAVGGPLNIAESAPEQSGRTVTLVAADIRHPIFRPFSSPSGALGDVYVEQYRRLNVQTSDSGTTARTNVLARFAGAGDALIEQPVDKGRLLVFASDLDNRWNRFPLNPAFVPWVIETTRYLAQGREQPQTFTLPDVPAGVPAEAGVHQTGNRAVAVNPDIRESSPARITPDEFRASISRSAEVVATRAAAVAREQEERQRLWQIGLLVMFVALASEGLIGRRAV